MNHIPHFPVATLTYNGNLIINAGYNHPEVAARLPLKYLGATGLLCQKITTDLAGQKNAKGELGNLTATQSANLDTLLHCFNQARQTAKLAFPGQTVKLHQEFQVGVNHPSDLASILSRADIVLASVNSNLAAFNLKGWTDADTAAFTAARQTFGSASEVAKSSAKDSTTTKNTDAVTLYENLLTIQNAADLQWPATDTANAGVRDEFRLNTFPPAGGGNSNPSPTPKPATTKL